MAAIAATLLALVLSGAAWAGPDQVTIRYARGFQVEYRSGCKIITLQTPWPTASTSYRYLLVPEGQTPPDIGLPAQIVRTPVRRVVPMSTTTLGYLDDAGLTDRIVGTSDFKYVNTPSVVKRIEQGRMLEVGHSSNLRIEALLDLAPT